MKNELKKSVLQRLFSPRCLKMKVTLTFLLFSFLQMHASSGYGQSNKISIIADELPLSQVFQLIEDQTDFSFFYNTKEIDLRQNIKFTAINEPVTKVLNNLFKDTDLSYHIFGNQIILKKKIRGNKPDISTPTSTLLLQQPITGTVTDEDGAPLPGITVVIEGTQKGTITNFDGAYSITLSEGENVLVFSSLAYKTERFEVGDNTVVNIVMQENLSQLEEVLLIGYGEQRREEVSGAVSSVATEDVVQASIGSIGFDRSLGGLVQGVQVSQGSGRPGSPVRLNIRGITSPLSTAGSGLNQPLYVIDGVPFNLDAVGGTNPLLTLNPDDIESFDILKDAAATSIYGSRGANGVIIIETKRGKRRQKPTVSLSTTTSIARPINIIDVLDGPQYRNYYDLLIGNSVNAINAGELDPFTALELGEIANVDLDMNTLTASYNGLSNDYFGTANTKWSDYVFRSFAVTQQTNFSIYGGSNKTNYNFSLSAIDQEGLTVKDKYKQYSLSLALDSDINNYVKVGGSANFSHIDAKSGEDGMSNGPYTVSTSIAKARPDLPVYDENGNLLRQPDYTYGFETLDSNPLMRLQHKNNKDSYNFLGNSYIEIEPLDGLKLKADVNAGVFYNKSSVFSPKSVEADFIVSPSESYLDIDDGLISNITTNVTANYSFKLAKHHFNILGGVAWDRTNIKSSNQLYAGFPDDDILVNVASAESVLGYSSQRLETGLNSLFSRLTYNYSNRYNVTLNFRTDTSSKFGPGNKRGYFPSLSASWNISNESFLNESEKINGLKLRASIGRVGSTNVSDFAYLQFFTTSSSSVYNGSSAVLPTDNFPNQNIGWETTEEINLGLDFAFFNSRLRGNIDVYNRKTTDALVNTPLPLELGPMTYYSNLIDVSNKGIEISLGGDIIRSKNFTWSTNVNWAVNRNNLDKLKGSNINPYLMDHFIEGYPVGTIMGYKVVKIFDNQEEIDDLNSASPTGTYDRNSTGVGDYMFEDINGDGQITSDDRAVIGDIEPDFFGGISNSFTYKNFTLSALFQFSVGAEALWDPVSSMVYNYLGENKYSAYGLNTWTPENPDARFARAIYTDPSSNRRDSDIYLYDTSYLRLKSLQLSYTLDQNLMNSMGIDSAQLMLTANNLYTWTSWPGMDPEALSERGTITDQTSGEDPYPLSKSFSLGVKVQF